jgi:hypothetical protein
MRKTLLYKWYNKLWGMIFVSKKKYIRYYKVGWRMYQLAETYYQNIQIFPKVPFSDQFISLSKEGVFIIKKGYVWDGSSGPTLQTKSTMRGSLLHDALYECMRKERLAQVHRYQADVIIRDTCIEDGMFKWRAKGWFDALRLCAEPFAEPKNRRKLLTAP